MGSRFRCVVAAALLTVAVVPSVALASPTGGALPPVLISIHQVAGLNGIPEDAVMVAATVTAIRPADRGWIKVYPCDQDEPETASLNYEADQVINNLVLSRIADDGTICVATFAVADYVIDLAGYVPAGSDITPLVLPARVLDTRTNGGPSPIPDDTTAVLDLADAGVPAGNNIAIFNLTAVSRDAYGHVTAYPCDQEPGTTSSVNFAPGRAVANLVITRLAADGTVCFHNKNQVDLIVDVAGYAIDGFATLPTPKRILNTRDTPGLVPAGTITIDPALPVGATAAIYNLTVVGATAPGHATAYPCDQPVPEASNVNYPLTVAAGAASITKLDPTGHFCIHTLTPAELIIDLIGYTTGTADYVPIAPVRLYDTRKGGDVSCGLVFAFGANTLMITDTVTGQTATFRPPEKGSFGRQEPAVAGLDCQSMAYYGTFDDSGFAIWRFRLDGTHERIVLHPDIPSLGEIRIGVSGTVYVMSSDGLYVASTGERVADRITASPANGRSLLTREFDPVLAYYGGAVDGHHIAVFDIDTGEELGLIETDVPILDPLTSGGSFEFSIGGPYIAVQLTTSGEQSGPADRIDIFTIFGDRVDTIQAEPGQYLNAAWIGYGSLAVCQGNWVDAPFEITRRDLFGSLLPLLPQTNPLVADCMQMQS